MRYSAVATDFDGTLAHDGVVARETIRALKALRASGRRCLLVTGRQLQQLIHVFPDLGLFDLVIAEDGVVIYSPETGSSRCLVSPPPDRLIQELTRRGVAPMEVGQGIIGIWQPHEGVALNVLRDLGLEYQVVFNKGAVMLVPSGHNKATGLQAGLEELGLSLRNTVGIGDAENDHAFLSACELSVAVANAVPAVLRTADLITNRDHGGGFVELAERLIADDLSAGPFPVRAALRLGEEDGRPICIPAWGPVILVFGPSCCGKSTYAAELLAQLVRAGYQCCVVNPEGDHKVTGACIGSASSEPPPELVADLLCAPSESVTLNLLAVLAEERQEYFARLWALLRELRALSGRPHWVLVDEAHHMLYPPLSFPELFRGPDAGGLILVTVAPQQLAPEVLNSVTHLIALGDGRTAAIEHFCEALEIGAPEREIGAEDQATYWEVGATRSHEIAIAPYARPRARHARKYAEADLGQDRSFYFRGRDGALNLPARNVAAFIDLGETVDDATWLYHLRRGDFGRWFRACLRDEELGALADQLASDGLSAAETRNAVKSLILRRYAPPA